MSVRRVGDDLELSRPQSVAMVLVTAAGGYLAAAHGVDVPRLVVVLLATGAVTI